MLLWQQVDTCAWVENERITRNDLALRGAVIKVFFSDTDAAKKIALNQLINTMVKAEVLRRQGYPVTEAQLQSESENIESSEYKDKLPQIKAILTKREQYFRLFVLPIFVEKSLTAHFGQRSDYTRWLVSENSKVKWFIKPNFELSR